MSTAAYPRLSVDQYHDMIRSGILTDDDQVELLEGWLVAKMPKNPPYRVATELAAELLRAVVPPRWYVTTQEPVTTSTSEPEPDISVVQGRPRDYIDGHPGPQHLAMVVEIADSSINRDRDQVPRLCSGRRADYWIVDVTDRRVEIRTRPTGPAEEPAYGSVQQYRPDETMPVIIGG